MCGAAGTDHTSLFFLGGFLLLVAADLFVNSRALRTAIAKRE
jgi:hypothetical protein